MQFFDLYYQEIAKSQIPMTNFNSIGIYDLRFYNHLLN